MFDSNPFMHKKNVFLNKHFLKHFFIVSDLKYMIYYEENDFLGRLIGAHFVSKFLK